MSLVESGTRSEGKVVPSSSSSSRSETGVRRGRAEALMKDAPYRIRFTQEKKWEFFLPLDIGQGRVSLFLPPGMVHVLILGRPQDD